MSNTYQEDRQSLADERSSPLVTQERELTQDFPRPLARVIDAMFTRGDAVKDILDFVREVRADMARIAYDSAMAAASLELPVIEKSRLVSYDHKDQRGKTSYKHADLADIHRICKPILGKHGLYYRFRVSNELNAPIEVTCILSHRDGHQESNTLIGGADTSGLKNQLQGMMSTITYLQRYTLLPLIGGSAGEDDDGRSGNGNGNAVVAEQYVTPAQGQQLIKEITEKGRSVDKFAQWAGIKDIYHLQASRFNAALAHVRSWTKGWAGAEG